MGWSFCVCAIWVWPWLPHVLVYDSNNSNLYPSLNNKIQNILGRRAMALHSRGTASFDSSHFDPTYTHGSPRQKSYPDPCRSHGGKTLCLSWAKEHKLFWLQAPLPKVLPTACEKANAHCSAFPRSTARSLVIHRNASRHFSHPGHTSCGGEPSLAWEALYVQPSFAPATIPLWQGGSSHITFPATWFEKSGCACFYHFVWHCIFVLNFLGAVCGPLLFGCPELFCFCFLVVAFLFLFAWLGILFFCPY